MNTKTIKLTLLFGSLFLLPWTPESQTLAAGPGVHGRVLGHDEQGKLLGVVSGAQIEFQDSAHVPVASVAADENGYYKADLAPGSYFYRIQAPGYRTEESGRGMRLINSQGYALFNLSLTQGADDPDRKPPVLPVVKHGKLRGLVLESTANGTSGIGNARITFRHDGTKELTTVYSRTTDQEQRQTGDYEITLPVGTYHAGVTARGFEPLQDSESIVIEEAKDAERNFLLSRPPLDGSTGQGIRGVVTVVDAARDEAHPAVVLEVRSLDGGSGTQVPVAENGEFSVDLPAGKYRVAANADGFPETASRPVYVFSGRYSRVNLALHARKIPEPETSIEVLVLTRSTETQTPSLLSDVTVSLLKQGADAATASEARTDATGHALFIPGEAGKYRIDAHAPGFQGQTMEVDVPAGERKVVSVELSREAAPAKEFTFVVAVTDALTKQPLPGVKVLARHERDALAGASRSTTDAAGKATLKVIKPGNYTLLAQAVGYSPVGAKSNVTPDQSRYSIDLAMRLISPPHGVEPQKPDEDQRPPGGGHPAVAPFSVTGFVAYRDPEGQLRGVKGAKLIWERISPAQPPMTVFTTSGENGQYEVKVQQGLHQVRVEPPAGFGTLLEQVQITKDGQEKYFVVVRSNLKPPGSVENLVDVKGVVVTEATAGREAGVKGAEILFRRGAGVANAQAGDGGGFQIRLAADVYRVFVRANGFVPFEAETKIQPEMQPLRLVLKRAVEQQPDVRLNLNVVQNAGRLGFGLSRSVAGAEVSVVDVKKQTITGSTNNLGQYSVRLPPGTYTVRVTRAGFRPETKQITVARADMTEQIVLTPGDGQPPTTTTQFTLTVRVLEHQEVAQQPKAPQVPHPINGATVTVIRGSVVVATGTTGGQGQYVVQLPNGEYSVKASAKGFGSGGKTISVAGKNTNVTLELSKQSRLNVVQPPTDLRRKITLPGNPGNAGKSTPPPQSYAVEYRLKEGSPWQEYGRYSSSAEAQQALLTAIAKRRIPRGAATRIEVKAF